jgi:hypothetical protein
MKILKPGEYQWKETPGGTGWVLLRHDPRQGTQTRLLRYGRGVDLPATELSYTVEWLMLRGEAQCGPLALRRRGFFCWPAGTHREAVIPGDDGYTVISFVYAPESAIHKPAAVIGSTDALPWEEDEPLAGAGPLPTRRINRDEASGAATYVIRLEADRSIPAIVLPSVTELFVVEGTLSLEGERLLPATYVAVEPGETIGPFAAEGSGGSFLLNTHSANGVPHGSRA